MQMQNNFTLTSECADRGDSIQMNWFITSLIAELHCHKGYLISLTSQETQKTIIESLNAEKTFDQVNWTF